MRSALLVIDMQKAYFNNEALAECRDDLVKSANELIASASANHVPVFNIMTEHAADRSTWTLNMLDDGEGYLLRGSEDAAVVDGLDIETAERIVKTRDSAFFGTDLAVRLREQGVDTIILLGVSTHGCVLQTAADTYAENFKVIIAREAVASHDPRYDQPILDMLTQEYRQPQYDNDQVREVMGL